MQGNTKNEQTVYMSYYIIFTAMQVFTCIHTILSLMHKQSRLWQCSGCPTYTATGQNLSIKRDCVVFICELVSYKVIHLWYTNTKQS